MKTLLSKTKGFTLVELIVVIAIIAILATVSIIGFTRYIRNARWSNDEQLARQMTNLVQYHVTATGLTDLDAHDVRTIVTDNSGDGISFTPQTDGAVFVYVGESQEVVLSTVEDILSGETQLSRIAGTQLLSDPNLELAESVGETPEEIFGTGTFLLSKTGSSIAEAVSGIRNLTKSSALEEDYAAIVSMAGESDRIQNLVDQFTLTNTLFVNNNDWPNIPTNQSAPFKRILFQEGIRNIPSMVTNSRLLFTIESTITLPSTVFSIEENAFAQLLLAPGVSFDLSRPSRLTVETGAFAGSQVETYDLDITESELPELGVVAFYSTDDGTTWNPFAIDAATTLTEETRVKFDIQGTPRELIDDLAIQRIDRSEGLFYVIRAYNDVSGLIGVAEYEVEYSD